MNSRECEYCHSSFIPRLADVKKGKGRFCSKSCARYCQKVTPTEDRLWSKLMVKTLDECWEYKERLNHCGYGSFHIGNKTVLAHRIMYQLTSGCDIEGYTVLHSCDNPACCNPSHLWLGTQQDNIEDMHKKGRGVAPKGENQHKSKLTESEVIEIRSKYGLKDRHELAKEYGVHRNSIMGIVQNKTWKHLL